MLLQQVYMDASGAGESSRWREYLATMKLRVLGKAVLHELR